MSLVGYAGTVEDIAARKQSEDEQQRRGQVMAILYGTTRDLVAGHKVTSLVRTLAQRAVVLVGSGHSRVYLYDPDGRNLDWVGSTDSKEPASAAPLLQDQEMINQAVQIRKVAVLDSYTWQASPGRDDAPSGATAVVSMFQNAALLGAIIVDHADLLHRFTDQEVHALSLFAKHAAAPIDHVQYLENASQRAKPLPS